MDQFPVLVDGEDLVGCFTLGDDDLGFVRGRWKRALYRPRGSIDRHCWQLALLTKIRGVRRGGDLWVKGSDRCQNPSRFLLSDQHSQFGTRVIATTEREATYVLQHHQPLGCNVSGRSHDPVQTRPNTSPMGRQTAKPQTLTTQTSKLDDVDPVAPIHIAPTTCSHTNPHGRNDSTQPGPMNVERHGVDTVRCQFVGEPTRIMFVRK